MTPSKNEHSTLVSTSRRQKRASQLALVLMGATPFVIFNWDPLYSEFRVLRSVADCSEQTDLKPDVCQALWAEARSRHKAVSPQYKKMEACESDFGHFVDRKSCDGSWCPADSFSGCEWDGEGVAHPEMAGLLVDTAVLKRLADGETLTLAQVSEDDLQPVYGMSDEALESSSDSGNGHYYSSYGWHFFTAGGGYVGRSNVKGALRRSTSMVAGRTTPLSGLSAQRGGFGATARTYMARATG
ncbi:DUF1190 domain-containing protein [Marinobacter mangrovi]|uniref:DUF1190 domain-containing protein n=1 Tax=Marinobacter mangrovi TaxID=2803918 RepID=UPI001933EC01|nr:DUF1190 domain-containing protein [Marinobacter mangrovi]